MVVDHWRDIAFWYFQFPYEGVGSELTFETKKAGFLPLMEKLYQCFKILEKYQLLLNNIDITKDKSPSLCLNSLEHFIMDCRRFRYSEEYDTCYLMEGGQGMILSATGEPIVYNNVITLQTTQLPVAIFIHMHSTDFLPYTLDGYPQKEVYKYNAPRLEQAMQEIEACLGLPPLMDEIDYSDYCLIKGYRLMNLYQEEIDDGRIMVLGLNEAGHVLPEAEMAKIEVDPNYVEEFGKP